MNPRDIAALALCGFDTSDPDQTGAADNIISLTFEKAIHEAATLRFDLDANPATIMAGSLEGRLQALDAFISEYMIVTWKQPEADKSNGAGHAEVEAQS